MAHELTRREALAVGLALAGSAAAATPALAYLSDGDRAENRFRLADNVIEVDEDFDPVPDGSGTVTKVVRAANTGTCDCWVRGLVAVSSTLDVTGVLYNTEAWTRASDGWWYLSAPLAPGEASEPLMTGATAATGSVITVCLESCATCFGARPEEAFGNVGKAL